MGVPTQKYLAPARLWNASKTRGTLEVTADPAHADEVSSSAKVDLPKGTKARQLAEVGELPELEIETLQPDGTPTGKFYWVQIGSHPDGRIPIEFRHVADCKLLCHQTHKRSNSFINLPSWI